MKTTIIVLVFFTYLTWGFNSVAVEENITVEVLIYSGRPNPTWKITDTNESQTLENQLKDLQEISEQPSGWSTLGFQGFIIRGLKISGLSGEVRIFKGVVEVQTGKGWKYLKDKNGIEQKLIDASKRQELADYVKEAIMKYEKSVSSQDKKTGK